MAGIALRLILCATLLPGFFLPSPALAGAAPGGDNGLLRFFTELRSLDADFEQVIVDPQGRLLERTRGSLQILRPGRFRWAYDAPYEQLIVTDGATLWVFDPDLEQVTVSELDTSVGNTPALLLSTERPLRDLFFVGEPEADGETTWLLLEPRDEETSFTRIFLGFDGDDALAMMEIIDGFGQSVQIRFSNLRRNAPVDPSLFEFTPPPGIDVIGEEARPQ
jgi:outer membrane lipoprotein carrier protein